jgi:tRNA-2-methylthio-N6-dimethylallyladenosine synthase
MKFYIKTFGCQMNVYDSALVEQKLLDRGMVEADTPDDADIVIVNTCSVRKKAEIKAFDFIRTMKNRNKRVIVMGCTAQLLREKLLEEGADAVIGPRSYPDIEEIVSLKNRISVEDKGYLEWSDLPIRRRIKPGQVSAFINIMQGCDRVCSFCVVPKTRGREVSRPHDDILREAKYLEKKGILEITLLGQNVDAYFDGKLDFSELLKFLDEKTGFYRIRFTTSHPTDMTFKVIETVKNSRRITDWFHLPLQAGSTKILGDMRRGYTKEEYIELIQNIRKYLPEAVITTDIMVGYPGETEEDFEETLEVVRRVSFDHAYTFIFSPRPGTRAARSKDQVDPETKGKRLRRLIDVVNEEALKRRFLMMGKSYDILIEGPSRKDPNFSAGRTRGNIKCIVEGNYAPGTILKGKVVDIKGLTPVIEYEEILSCLETPLKI